MSNYCVVFSPLIGNPILHCVCTKDSFALPKNAVCSSLLSKYFFFRGDWKKKNTKKIDEQEKRGDDDFFCCPAKGF